MILRPLARFLSVILMAVLSTCFLSLFAQSIKGDVQDNQGTPLFYINGRKVRDLSELEQLKSEDIKSIRVITNPESKYDASVGSVVLIQTRRIKGDGFGFDLRSSYYQSRNTDLIDEANWNYRHNRLDLFGTLQYSLMNNYNHGHVITISQIDTLWKRCSSK